MNVLVLGGQGNTGKQVIECALSKGHVVTALLRNPANFAIKEVKIVVGDATNLVELSRAVQGQDAVISTIGGTTPYKKTTLEQTVALNLIQAMQQSGVQRLLIVTMMGIGGSERQAPFWYRYLLMPTFLRGSTADKREVERIIAASKLDYTLVRPAVLKNGAAKGAPAVLRVGVKGSATDRADLALFLVDSLVQQRFMREAVTVATN